MTEDEKLAEAIRVLEGQLEYNLGVISNLEDRTDLSTMLFIRGLRLTNDRIRVLLDNPDRILSGGGS